ncbi:MAG: hypothetical protein CML17_07905 [Pusillimonas sp.]|jgi:hypothetical protein|nr:hypothetical protein [Pusillimonas sp.]|tara:strand:+ start:1370 stop:1804 length:435 start_codon:yes stop_codon:yes gene_type:complete
MPSVYGDIYKSLLAKGEYVGDLDEWCPNWRDQRQGMTGDVKSQVHTMRRAIFEWGKKKGVSTSVVTDGEKFIVKMDGEPLPPKKSKFTPIFDALKGGNSFSGRLDAFGVSSLQHVRSAVKRHMPDVKCEFHNLGEKFVVSRVNY